VGVAAEYLQWLLGWCCHSSGSQFVNSGPGAVAKLPILIP
jgi:hypothetical protein